MSQPPAPHDPAHLHDGSPAEPGTPSPVTTAPAATDASLPPTEAPAPQGAASDPDLAPQGGLSRDRQHPPQPLPGTANPRPTAPSEAGPEVEAPGNQRPIDAADDERVGELGEEPSRRTRWEVVVLVALVVVTALGLWAWSSRRAATGVRYSTRAVDRGSIREEVLTTGNLQPVLTVNVGSQISGQVLGVYVDYNSRVRKGQLLARIDPRNLQAQREQTEADLHNAEASIQSADAGIESARTGVESAEAGIASAQATLAGARAAQRSAAAQVEQARGAVRRAQAQQRLARLGFERNQQLVSQDLVAIQDLDNARAAYASAQADTQSAEGQVAAAEAAVASGRANLANVEAALQAARVKRATALAQEATARAQRVQALAQREKTRATLRQILVNLGFVDIRAPVDGIVIARQIDPGQTVAASFQTPLMFVVATNLHHMQVLASVDESDISRVFVGQEVSFTVNAWPGEVFRGGRVLSVRNNPQIVQNVVTYQVLVDIRNDDLRLRPGMTANLTMLYAQRGDAVRVPNAALRYRPPQSEGQARSELGPGRAVVWVAGAGGAGGAGAGEPEARAIRTGITDGVYTEVLDATLQPGEKVIVGNSATAESPSAAASPTQGSALRVPRR